VQPRQAPAAPRMLSLGTWRRTSLCVNRNLFSAMFLLPAANEQTSAEKGEERSANQGS